MMEVAVIGGGMIVHDQILPALYELQRKSAIGNITVCARNKSTLEALSGNAQIARAFPGHWFTPHPGDYKELLRYFWRRNIAIIALPDQIHFEVAMEALRNDLHVICVKPLTLTAAESLAVEEEARKRDLLVLVEYHKRFDDRSLMARQRYREGLFGEFRLGHAWLHEKWHYRSSNFQNWFTCENSDTFTYIGCHYVDLVHFITGLRPASVSVYGIPEKFPNGNEGYLWSDARVIWDNGACLNVQNALGYPQNGPGSNAQGLVLYCSGNGEGAMIRHSDQYRGLEYSQTNGYHEPSPDYFQYVDLGGKGFTPVGYGVRSIEALVRACVRIEEESEASKADRIREVEQSGILATPANSRHNEFTVEAGRLSLANGGREAVIDYQANRVYLR